MVAVDSHRSVELEDADAGALRSRLIIAAVSPECWFGLKKYPQIDALWLLLDVIVQRADQRVLLELAVLALLDGFAPLRDPLGEDAELAVRRDVDRRVDGEVVVVDLARIDVRVALLVRHAGRAHRAATGPCRRTPA